MTRRHDRGRFHHFRQPEIEHLHSTVRTQLDVRRFEVAVDDALLVRGLQGVRDLPGDGNRLIERNRTLDNTLGERGPLDQLHHQRVHGRLP